MKLYHKGKEITVREIAPDFHELVDDIANYTGLDINSTFSFGDENESTAPIYRLERHSNKDLIIISFPDRNQQHIEATFILNEKFCLNVIFSNQIEDIQTITKKLKELFLEYQKIANPVNGNA